MHRSYRPRGSYGWGGAALLQISLQLSVAFAAMLLFDPRRTSNVRRPAAEDAVVFARAEDRQDRSAAR